MTQRSGPKRGPSSRGAALSSRSEGQYIEKMVSSESEQDQSSGELSTRELNPARTVEPLAAILFVREGRSHGSTLRVGPGVYRIGASADCDLVLDDPAVSRHHLEIQLAPEGVAVRDLESRNGTFYLGARVGAMNLALGSRLTVGETSLEVLADREDFEGTQGVAPDHYGPLYGISPPMKRLFTLMKRLEGSLVNVLIEGESGTGKELIARALHDRSTVQKGPFIAINCGALDRALVRSELFGHKKGAFTGAHSETLGAFAEADGGTLFLDEMGELPLEIQPVLLRALESGSFCRVGETRSRPAKVRVIAATHRNLKDDVADGLFRADLYYRLMVVKLDAPPLRVRKEDIPIMAGRICAAEGLSPPSPELMAELNRRAYPGNVRELKHALLAHAAVGELPPGEPAGEDQLDLALRLFLDTTRPYAEQKEVLVDRMTRLYLQNLIEKTGGNRSEAARIAGLQRGYVRRLLEKFGLD